MDCRPFRKHENKMFDVADTFAFSSHTLRSHNWTSRTLYQTCLYFIYTGFFRWLSDFYEGLRERRKTEQRKKTSNENLESKNAFFVCVCLCADTLWLLLKLYRNESWKEIDFEHFGSYYFLWKNVLPLYSGSTFFCMALALKCSALSVSSSSFDAVMLMSLMCFDMHVKALTNISFMHLHAYTFALVSLLSPTKMQAPLLSLSLRGVSSAHD